MCVVYHMTRQKHFYQIIRNTIVLLILSGGLLHGQQFRQQGLYMLDPYQSNPAFGGLNNSLTMTGDFRRQWSELTGAPIGQFVSANMPLYAIQSGVGINLFHETLGASRAISGDVSYNYIFTQFEGFLLSAGVGLGVRSNQIDGSRLRTPDGNYENIINHNDPNIPITNSTANSMVIVSGLALRSANFELGLGSYQTIGATISKEMNYNYAPANHLTLYGSTFLRIIDDWMLSPNLLLKYDFRVLQTEIDVLAYYGNLFGGLGMRGYSGNSSDAFKVILGGRITEKIQVAYNYEMTISGLKSVAGNTHELLIQYRIPASSLTKQREKIIYHPRM